MSHLLRFEVKREAFMKVDSGSTVTSSVGNRLEQYTTKRPNETLIVTVTIDGEDDQIIIFRGFSSSLMRPTAFDPDVPVLPEHAKIITIDRVESPYNPDHPRFIQQGLDWQTIQAVLAEAHV